MFVRASAGNGWADVFAMEERILARANQPRGQRRVGQMVFWNLREPDERTSTWHPTRNGVQKPDLAEHVSVGQGRRLGWFFAVTGVAASRMVL